MTRTRLAHSKSRRGCIKCKERHVKCDEKRPCGNCIRRSDSCSLGLSSPGARRLESQPLPPNTRSSSNTASTGNQRASPNGILPAVAHHLDFVIQSPTTSKSANIKKLLANLTEEISSLNQDISYHSERQLPPFETHIPNSGVTWEISPRDWMRDLQLLHHYYSATCITLACDTSVHHVWREVVPQTACSHDFLMHGMLAISATHLAHTAPDRKDDYDILSTRHQTAALELFTSRLRNVTQSNCHAYVLVGFILHMMSTFSIADMHRKGETVAIAHVSQSFKLLRGNASKTSSSTLTSTTIPPLCTALLTFEGIQEILSLPSAWEWLESGPLASLFTTTKVRSVDVVPEFLEHILTLVEATRNIASTMRPPTIISPCLHAIESLKHAYWAIAGATSSPGSMWIWPMSLSQDFLNLINDNHPAALIILSHYVVLIHPFEQGLWFLQGWSKSVIEAVDCAVDVVWKEWIQWPVLCIREATDIIGEASECYA